MDEDDDCAALPCDTLCERAETIRGIAVDLDSRKSAAAKKLLVAAANCLLQSMRPPSADVLTLVPKTGKPAKERPL